MSFETLRRLASVLGIVAASLFSFERNWLWPCSTGHAMDELVCSRNEVAHKSVVLVITPSAFYGRNALPFSIYVGHHSWLFPLLKTVVLFLRPQVGLVLSRCESHYEKVDVWG